MKSFSQLLLFLAGFISAQPSGHRQPSPIAFTHVAVVDTANSSIQPDMTLVITGDHIAEIGKASRIKVPPFPAQVSTKTALSLLLRSTTQVARSLGFSSIQCRFELQYGTGNQGGWE